MKKRTGILLLILLLLLGTGLGLTRWLFADLPAPQEISQRLVMPSVRITDRYGRPLYDVLDANSGRHTVLALADIPLHLRQATIATEDKNFYHNPGVDLVGILRAFWINVRGGEVLAGGSTITQQVTRNLLLDADERSQRTVRRKLRESWLAWQVARQFDKDEILALYLNQMYYGAMAYGVEAAAQTYFAKPAADLTLAQSALLVGLTQAPARYNPFLNPEAAKERQQVVLHLMRQQGVISADEYKLAVREPLHYAATPYPVAAPHFVMMVQAELDERFPPDVVYASGGLAVRTTLDLDWQQHGQRIVAEQLRRLNHPAGGSPGHNAHNAALVALDPHNGQVKALVGSPDYFDDSIGGAINMALEPRQPGSALKPIIYAAAMDPGQQGPWTAASLLPDVRTVFQTQQGDAYVPVNFSRQEHGPVLLRQALASSLNIPAVLVLDAIGVERAMAVAADLGIDSMGAAEEYDLSFALGGGPVSLLDLTAAYAGFANGGSRIQPSLILDVTDTAGNLVYTAEPPSPVRVLDGRVAWLISDILSDDDARMLSFGTNSVLKLDRPAAVKTGTTNDFHDNWTVGYTPDLVVGVWVGNADNEPMRDVTGLSGAGPIWHYFMRTVLAGQPLAAFTRPPGLVPVEVCALSGLLPGDHCPHRTREWFIDGTQPAQTDTFFRPVTVDKATGLLAGEDTPPAREAERLVLDLPAVLHPWARAQGLDLWHDLQMASEARGETAVSAAADPSLRLVSPDPQAVYRLSPALPQAAQKLRLQAVGDADFRRVSLWIDDGLLATLDTPPFEAWWTLSPGQHQVWAEGYDADGAHVVSQPVDFEVRRTADE